MRLITLINPLSFWLYHGGRIWWAVVPGQEQELEDFQNLKKRSILLLRCFENCLGLFLSSSMKKGNWVLEWRLDFSILEWSNWIILSPPWFSPYLPSYEWPNRGICPPTYLLSLIFQTLLICPGHLRKCCLSKDLYSGVETHVSRLPVCLVTWGCLRACVRACVYWGRLGGGSVLWSSCPVLWS